MRVKSTELCCLSPFFDIHLTPRPNSADRLSVRSGRAKAVATETNTASPPRATNLFLVRNATRNRVIATRVFLAGTSRDRRIGLSRHARLDSQEGLLLTPCEAIHTFGMRFSLDVLFIDPSGKVRALRQGLRPRRVAVCWRARSTLELAAGAIRRSGTEVGDLLEFLRLPASDSDEAHCEEPPDDPEGECEP